MSMPSDDFTCVEVLLDQLDGVGETCSRFASRLTLRAMRDR